MTLEEEEVIVVGVVEVLVEIVEDSVVDKMEETMTRGNSYLLFLSFME